MGAMKRAALGAPSSALLFQPASRDRTDTAAPSHHLSKEINLHVKKRRPKTIPTQQPKGLHRRKARGLLGGGQGCPPTGPVPGAHRALLS